MVGPLSSLKTRQTQPEGAGGRGQAEQVPWPPAGWWLVDDLGPGWAPVSLLPRMHSVQRLLAHFLGRVHEGPKLLCHAHVWPTSSIVSTSVSCVQIVSTQGPHSWVMLMLVPGSWVRVHAGTPVTVMSSPGRVFFFFFQQLVIFIYFILFFLVFFFLNFGQSLYG